MFPRNQPLYGNDTKTLTTLEPNDCLEYLFRLAYNDSHRRSGNYTLDDKTLSQSIAFSVTYLNNEPVLGSLAWIRDMYGDAVRVATKYCVHPEYRDINFGKGTENLFRLDTIDHIIQQKDIAFKKGYSTVFISQEDNSPRGRRIKQSTKTLSKHTGLDWICTESPVLVAPDPNEPSCWQYAISTKPLKFDYSNYKWISEQHRI